MLSSGINLPNTNLQQPVKLEDPPWVKEVASKPIVYSIPGMKRVKVKRNIVYKRIDNSDLNADIYSPPSIKGGAKLPAVIYIHGGRIPPNLLTKPKDWGVYQSHGKLIAASGFIGITFNHRYYGYDYLDEAQSDVDSLIEYIRSNADTLNIDKNRIIVWAFSAGGMFLSHAIRDRPSYIRGIVAYYTMLDARLMRKQAPSSISNETLRDYSPLYYLQSAEKMVMPIFIARAGQDDINLNKIIDNFAQEAINKNVNLDFSNHTSGRHGFDVHNDDERSREIIKQTLEFIKMNTRN